MKTKGKMLSVYIAHPYKGKEENKQKAAEICREVVKIDCLLPISPIHVLSFYDESINPDERELALKLCQELVKKCDLVLMCGDWPESEGCRTEFKTATENNIPVIDWAELQVIKRWGVTQWLNCY